MTISSIGGSAYPMGQMSAMGGRPGPGEMFGKMDEDDSGGLDKTEFSELAKKISEITGEDVDGEALFAAYDEDGDGQLSETETRAVMEDYRPEGPPPGGMGPMQGSGPDLSQIFSDADTDEDGALDETEAESLAEMISNATGETVSVDDLVADYDADGDGLLSEEETLEALEANRPAGPPPPPPGEMAENGGSEATRDASAGTSAAIENYLKMAALGSESDQGAVLSALFGNDSNLSSAAALYSINTLA